MRVRSLPSRSWRAVRRPLAVVAAMAVLVGCDRDPACADGPGIEAALASAERWVRVVSLLSAPEGNGTVELGADVAPVGAGLEEEPSDRETVAVHEEFLDDVDQGLRDGDRVYLALVSEGLEREMVAYVVRLRDDGTATLGGDECLAEGDALLRDRLGDRYDAAITSVIGLGDREEILERLASTAVASPNG